MDGANKRQGSQPQLRVSDDSLPATPEGAHRLQRTQTVCSSHPLRHKDKRIPQEKRERFEALDLEVLLSEFKAVAVMAQGKEEEESDEREAEGARQPGADEIEWLREAGFPSLAETHLSGTRIGEAEVVGLTEVLSPEMAATVRKRVSFLNGLLGDGGGDGGGAAAAPAAPAKSEPLEIPGGPSRGNSDQLKTPPRSPPSLPRRSVSEHNGARRAPSRTAEVTEVPTRFDDLGDGDKAQLQYLNVVHLTTILESKKIFKISKTAHKAKMKKGTEGNTFGVNLEHLVERDLKANPGKVVRKNVPIILSTIVDFLSSTSLSEEGIFRKAGHVGRIKDLRQKCEDSGGVVSFEAARPHDVAALLKQFLRETPEPLLTSQYIETFYTTEKLQEPAERLRARKLLAMLLPPVHRACLELLLNFLRNVAANEEKTKMGIPNLAVVFAPSLFFIRGHKGQKMLKEVEIQVHTASTLRGLLENADVLWDVPKEILKQLRNLTEHSKGSRKASNAKDVQKMLKKVREGKSKATAPSFGGEMRAGDRLVWVEDPTGKPPIRAKALVSWNGGEKEVDVYDATTAEELLERLGHNDGKSHVEEREGNIGSRKLHPASHILPVLHANNDVHLWIIKT
eukprot:m.76892 g.76892  ORF g.76892 m.76892 type:complete len:624 (-) comp10563_c0_seq1:224-2095(-)